MPIKEDEVARYVAGGATLEKVRKLNEDVRTCRAAWQAFAKKLKGEAVAWHEHGDVRIAGVDFEGQAPKGWKRSQRGGFHCPDKRCREGKAAAKALAALPRVVFPFAKYFHGLTLYTAGIEHLGDQVIISHHAQAPMPEGCRLLKHSEYWAMKEAAAATTRGKKR